MDDQNGTRFIVVAVAQDQTLRWVFIDPQTGRVAKISGDKDEEND